MGTSMGTVTALMPIAIDIAQKTGVNVALVGGIVVGGAMFGDNLSFISDTTIAATRTQNIGMKEKFKANVLMVLPAVIINLVLLALQSISTASIVTKGSVDPVNLIPYVLVIVLSLIGINVIPVMTLGVVSGMVIGIAHKDFTWVESFKIIHEGMTWMEDMAIIAILVGGLVALINYLGGIDWLMSKLSAKTKTRRGGELSIAALVSLIDIAPQRTASILDLFSSAFNGLLPYAGQLLVAGGLAKVSPVKMMPFNWYSMLMLVFGIFFIIIGWPKFKKKESKKAAV